MWEVKEKGGGREKKAEKGQGGVYDSPPINIKAKQVFVKCRNVRKG